MCLYFITPTGRSPVPLQNIAVQGTVVDTFAKVRITQTYRNDRHNPIEAVYRFPLDEQSGICGFEADVDGKKVIGKVEEKAKAFETYDRAIAQGNTAMLLDEERSDVFSMSVGNIPARGSVIVTITYMTSLRNEGDDLRFSLPAIIGDRYTSGNNNVRIPGSAPAVSIDAYLDPLHPRPPHGMRNNNNNSDSSNIHVEAPPTSHCANYPTEITIALRMSAALKSVTSSSHPVSLELGEASGTAVVTLSQEDALRKEFVLEIATRDPHRPTVCCEIDPASRGTTAMLSIFPFFDQVALDREYVFLVDRSGSMGGSKIEQCKNALQLFVRSLPFGSRFNIVSFGSTHSSLFPAGRSEPLNDDNLRRATSHIEGMSANMGGTEILSAIKSVISPSSSSHFQVSRKGSKQARGNGTRFFNKFFGGGSRQRRQQQNINDIDDVADMFGDSNIMHSEACATQVLVLTDGQVSNTQSVIKTVSDATSKGSGSRKFRFFSLGIGNGASHELVAGIARGGRGIAEFVANGERLESKVLRQLRRMTIPSLSSATVSWLQNNADGSVSTLGSVRQCPEELPPVFSGDRLSIFATFPSGTVPDGARLTGFTADGVAIDATVDLPREGIREGAMLRKIAARETIRFLQDRRGDTAKAEIVSIALAHNLASRHTSFVAVCENEIPIDSRRSNLVVVPQVQSSSSPSTTSRDRRSSSRLTSSFSVRRGYGGARGGALMMKCASSSAPMSEKKKKCRAKESIPRRNMDTRPQMQQQQQQQQSFFGGMLPSAPACGAPPPPPPAPASASMDMASDLLAFDCFAEKEEESVNAFCNTMKLDDLAPMGRYAAIDDDDDSESDGEDEWESAGRGYQSNNNHTAVDNRPDELIRLQLADGRWSFDAAFSKFTGVRKPIAIADERELQLWATAIAVATLRSRFMHLREEWEMIVAKALTWITSNLVPPYNSANDVMSKANDVLTSGGNWDGICNITSSKSNENNNAQARAMHIPKAEPSSKSNKATPSVLDFDFFDDMPKVMIA